MVKPHPLLSAGRPGSEAQNYIEGTRALIIHQMRQQRPDMKLHTIGEVAYRVDHHHPMEILERSGFLPQQKSVSVIARENSNNKGLVDFSLVPEAAALACVPGQEQYLYAAPVDQAYIMEGQKRQVLAPALPSPEFLVARQIIATDGKSAKLDSPIIIGDIPEKYKRDEAFRRFLTAPSLAIPQDISLGDENNPAVYDIADTPASRRLFPSPNGSFREKYHPSAPFRAIPREADGNVMGFSALSDEEQAAIHWALKIGHRDALDASSAALRHYTQADKESAAGQLAALGSYYNVHPNKLKKLVRSHARVMEAQAAEKANTTPSPHAKDDGLEKLFRITAPAGGGRGL